MRLQEKSGGVVTFLGVSGSKVRDRALAPLIARGNSSSRRKPGRFALVVGILFPVAIPAV